MKLTIRTAKNEEKGTIEFPIVAEIRPDLIRRAVLALQSRTRQPYGADPRAGLKHSTRISRRRRDYRGSYGYGISRVPRKILSRAGRRMYWVGAEAPGTVGGRRAHPPKATKKWAHKINKKENRRAIDSAMVCALTPEVVSARGHKVPKHYPFALDASVESLSKTKDVLAALQALGLSDDLARGASGAKSVLLVTENEAFARAARNIPGVDAFRADELNAHMLAPGGHPGRATLFTVTSIKRLSGEPAPKKEKAPAKAAKPAPKSPAPKKPEEKVEKKEAAPKKTAKKTAKKAAKKAEVKA